MVTKDKRHIKEIKICLFNKLKDERAFWSYDPATVTIDTITDDQLIALTLRQLDLEDIDHLFEIFTFTKIKKAWVSLLVPEGPYLYTLNRFLSWYYFRAKRPDTYLKTLETRHLNNLLNT